MFKTFKPASHKVKCLVYGASGVGKTRFAATAPKPVFLSAEAGLLSTIGVGDGVDFAEIKSLADLQSAYHELAKGGHKYETVVIDSITEINEIIKEGIEAKTGKSMQLQDWGTLAKSIRGILRNFRNLDMHVVFIAQEQNEMNDQKISKIVPSLNGKAATGIAYYMDTVGYMYMDAQGDHSITTKPNKQTLSKSRCIFDDVVDFSVWVKELENLEITKPAPAPATTTAPPANTKKLDVTSNKAIHASWKELMDLQGEPEERREGLRKATLKKLFDADSNNDLTIAQAKQFVAKIKTKISTFKSEPEFEPEPVGKKPKGAKVTKKAKAKEPAESAPPVEAVDTSEVTKEELDEIANMVGGEVVE